ncbi:MAG: GNAT family N-acetyltransferase, partial [Clostridia bacterium]
DSVKNPRNIALYSPLADAYCLYGNDTKFVDKYISSLSGVVTLSGINKPLAEYILLKYKALWRNSCGLYVYNGRSLPKDEQLPSMRSEFWEMVARGTFYEPPEEEVRYQLVNYLSSAIYVDDLPVCWCAMHTEGSLGMLYTLPEYRHKGLALKVMIDITNKVIEAGQLPFAYIVKGNIASEALATKYNLEYFCDAEWLAIDKGEKQCK